MPYIGELSALVTAVMWSGTALVFSSAIARVGSVQVNITRMLIALVLLAVSVAVMELTISLTPMQFVLLALSGVAGLVLGDSFLFRAFKEVGPRISVLMMALAPALSSILAYFFLGEVLTYTVIAGMAVTLAGIGLVVLERQQEGARYAVTPSGLLYAFGGALGQASGLVLAKSAFAIAPVHAFVATLVRIGVSVGILLPVMAVTGRYGNPIRAYRHEGKALGQTALGAVIGPYLGITFSLLAIAHAKVGVAATIMAMSPIIMLPLLVFIYKEALNWKAYIGAALAVGGVAVLFLA